MNGVFSYGGQLYPEYLRTGNAMQFIAPAALHFCKGRGLDIGAGKWPLAGAEPVELAQGRDGNGLPAGAWDYIFSSHALEHLVNPVAALEHWKSRLRPGGVLFLYLPSPEMKYWRPEHCRKHLHLFRPRDIVEILLALGFIGVMNSERDLCWSFAVVGFNGHVEVES